MSFRYYLIIGFLLHIMGYSLSSQVFYTVDFNGDQANLAWGDCGMVFNGYLSYPPGENVIDISSTNMVFIDVEGANCPSSCNSGDTGGDLLNFYTTDILDISGKCAVQVNVTFSIFNDTNFAANNMDCGSGCGEDWLSFAYSIDGGAFEYFNAGETNQYCVGRNISGNTYSFSSDIFSGTDLEIQIQFGSQSVTEGLDISLMELEELPVTLTVDADAVSTDICVGQDIELTESGGDADMWNWAGPNSFTSANQNPTITGSDLPGIGTHTYDVTITDTNGCTDTDDVQLTVSAGFDATWTTPAGGDVVVCEGSCASSDYTIEISFTGGNAPYDITLGGLPIPVIIPNLPSNFITFCEGSLDLDFGADPIEITIPAGFFDFQLELLSATDANGCNGNIIGGLIDVMLQDQPSIDDPTVVEECLLPGETLDLTQYDNDIGGGEDVIWLSTQDVSDLIGSPTSYNIADGNPVYAVVYEDPCYSEIKEVQLAAIPRPEITITQSPIYSCGDEYLLPDFDDVATIDNGVNPQYYLDSGLTNGPYTAFSTVPVNYGSNDIYIFDESGTNCNDVQSYELIALQAPDIVNPSGILEECGSITLPFPTINNQDNLDFSYNTDPDGFGAEYLDGDIINETDGISLLYLIAINNEGTQEECIDTTHVTLSFLGGTSFTANIPAQVCDSLFLPPILPLSLTAAFFDTIPGGIRYLPGDTITFAQAQAGNNVLDTLYLYDPTQSGACASIDTLVFEIGHTPILDVPVQTQFCDQGILPPPSTNNPNLQYASDRDFNNILNPIFPINQSTQIYYRDSFAFANGGACYAIDSFFLEIIDQPNAGLDSSIVICELTNQSLNLFDILGNPDTDGDFTTDSGLSLFDPTNVDIVNIKEGNYTIDYEIDKPGCPTQMSQIMIEVVPPLDVGELSLDSICSSIGVLDIPFLMGNPMLGGDWFFADSDFNEITVPDPTNWDVTGLPEGVYRITYTIIGTDNNPYCANRSSVSFLTIIGDPVAGIDTTLRVCQGFSDLVNLYELLDNPEQGGSFTIDGNPIDFEITDPTSVDLSVLPVGSQEIYYSIEKPGCTPAVSTLIIDVAPTPSVGIARNDTICATSGSINPQDYIVGNDPIFGFKVYDSAGVCLPAAPAMSWIFSNIAPGVYEVVYSILPLPNYACSPVENSFEITIFESINAGDDSDITICKGQAADMNALLSSDAMAGGTFLQDGFPVSDPELWMPASLNDMVVVQYILEANSISCTPDTAFITVTLSDNLSAGDPTNDNTTCENQTINLSDFLDGETPGGDFFLSSDLNNIISDSYELLMDTEFTYIIPGAPGCEPDTTEFSLVTVTDTEVMMSLSQDEICIGDNDCIIANITTTVDGAIEIIIAGQAPQSIISFVAPTANGEVEVTLCPSLSFNNPPISFDTIFVGSDPVIQIDLNSIINTEFDCQSKSLSLSESIIINEDFQFSIDTTLCPGSSVMVGGQEFFASTDIIETRTNGCDSIVSIQINNFDLVANDLEQDLCQGQSYDNIPGYSFTSDIDTIIILQGGSAFNCDSTINLSLKFTDKAVGPLELDLCYGDSIEIDGVQFIEGMTIAEVPAPMPSVFGCDSATMVRVTFFEEVIPGSFTTSICEDETYPLGDMIYDANNLSGLSTLAGAAMGGCDSTVNVTIDLYPAIYNFTSDLCANDTIFIGGDAYHADNLSGLSSTQETTVNGCDSIVNVQLNLIQLEERIFRPELCEDQDFMINGETYNFSKPSGIEYIPNAVGCDSLIDISIIQLPSRDTILELELCSSADTLINGQLYNDQFTMGEATLATAFGCDSIVTVIVAVASPSVDFFIDYCSGESEGVIVITDIAGLSLPVSISYEGIGGALTITSLPYTTGGVEVDRDYTLELSDDNCSITETIRIESDAMPQLEILATEISPDTYQLSLETMVTASVYAWSASGPLSCDDCPDPLATITEQETISVELITNAGCLLTASIILSPDSIIVPPLDSMIRVYIPNTISSDDNGNQLFMPLSEEENVIIDEMQIFDRWGNSVFVNKDFLANSTADGWDGRRAGQAEVEQGVYVYLIKYTDPVLGEQLRQGTITVIR